MRRPGGVGRLGRGKGVVIPVRLVSGWGYPGSALAPLVTALREAGLRDVRPAGSEGLPEDGQPAVLVGWSLGGLRVFRYAMRHPAACRLCVLIGATPRFCRDPGDDFPGQPATAVRLMLRNLARDRDRVLRDFYRRCAAPADRSDADLDARLKEAARIPLAELENGLRELLETNVRPRVGEAGFPRLVLHGERDEVVPAGAARGWGGTAVTHLHPDEGHELPLRSPGWVARRIRDAVQPNNSNSMP